MGKVYAIAINEVRQPTRSHTENDVVAIGRVSYGQWAGWLYFNTQKKPYFCTAWLCHSAVAAQRLSSIKSVVVVFVPFMLNIPELLAAELSLDVKNVQNALELHNEGSTVPFIARYRKERTGEMNEVTLRALFDRYAYLNELEERKRTIVQTIEAQGKLTDDLKARIEACVQKNDLEDLYLPFKPKRRTRATIARERGLEPLAQAIAACNTLEAPAVPTGWLEQTAALYVSAERGVNTVREALQGASDILAEEVSEQAELRAHLRQWLLDNAVVRSAVRPEFPEGTTKFEMYRAYSCALRDIQPHNMLALRRGEAEDILTLDVEFDADYVQSYLERTCIHTRSEEIFAFYKAMLADAFDRLMKHTLIGEVRLEKKQEADKKSIETFGSNLRNLLLASPAGMKPTIGIDPGFRTGCKVAALDATGKLLEHTTIFPHASSAERAQAKDILERMIRVRGAELIAIGNGTAGRETDQFVAELLAERGLKSSVIKVMVNESGASIYSASDVARAEFPDLDITVRGAVSIARRLQDPLAELVKIDPKSIGVGQYQHDVDQKLLKKTLDATVESCVNYVGVDLNTASKELLRYVSGMTETVAANIVKHRNEHGAFRSRKDLLRVAKLGAKTFEQAAGFLRIRLAAGANSSETHPLDNSAVHPERYALVERMAADLGIPLAELLPRVAAEPSLLRSLNLQAYVSEDIGLPTLRDIVKELEKPGRDPRAEFRYAEFLEGVSEMRDLKPGMWLEGVVTNVTNFGAFVDVGVHQDGLVHISQLANRFVSNPLEVVKVGQVVKVRVVEVNEALKRISLSMKAEQTIGNSTGGNENEKKRQKTSY
jgi:uncharacterized protein